MTRDEKIELITRHAEEALTFEDLQTYLDSNQLLHHYIGFEISGKIHLGTGLTTMIVIKDLQKAGVDCSILLADWHSWINDNLGGDFKAIQIMAKEYFLEGMIAAMKCVGGDPLKIHFILGSEMTKQEGYWETVIDVAKRTTLSRMKRSVTILGRKEGDDLDFAKFMYPAMQVADIFFMKKTIAHAGIDQRKAHVIMRDIANKLQYHPLTDQEGNRIKPVALHHHLLLGLGKPPHWPVKPEELKDVLFSFKMSKSKPDSCIFIHDSVDEIERKIKKAFCEERDVTLNPILDWTKHLIFPLENTMRVERSVQHGGDIEYDDFQSLKQDFQEGKLHPVDLKRTVSARLIKILQPARDHFASGKPAKGLQSLEEIQRKSQ